MLLLVKNTYSTSAQTGLDSELVKEISCNVWLSVRTNTSPTPACLSTQAFVLDIYVEFCKAQFRTHGKNR